METEQHYYPHFDGPSWQRSCTKEIIKPIHGKISGTIPKWLNGVLIRNGPGLFKFGDTAFKHVFDGMALLHRFKIEDGNVTYQCRFVQSDVYKKNTQANRIVVTDFGTASIPDPCETIFHRISSIFTRNPGNTDNTAISVYPFGDEMYALSETGVMYRVDKDSLETERKLNSTETVGIITHTAHPHVSEDGTVYNLALSFPFNKSLYHIVRFPNKQNTDENDYAMFNKAHIIATIPTRWKLYPSYMHSFGLTENYFIIVEQPLSISIPKAFLSSLLNMPVHECFQWYKDEMTRFIVISRKTGELVEEFYSNAFCYFHTINQYEDSNHIVIDICTFKDSSVLDSFYIDAIKNAHSNPNYSDMITSVPERFVLPLGEKGNNHNFTENLVTITDTTAKAYLMENGSVIIKPELICDVVCELPAINYQHFMGLYFCFNLKLNLEH